MHDRHDAAGRRVLLRHRRCVREPRFLLDRQRIHVGAHHDRRAVAVLQARNDTGTADALGHVEAGGPELGGHTPGGFVFGERELRVRVEVLEQRLEVGGVVRADRIGELIGRCRAGSERREQRQQGAKTRFHRLLTP